MTVIEIRTDKALVPFIERVGRHQEHRLEGVPATARWWRRRVLRGDDGYLYTIETDTPRRGMARVSLSDSAYQTLSTATLGVRTIGICVTRGSVPHTARK